MKRIVALLVTVCLLFCGCDLLPIPTAPTDPTQTTGSTQSTKPTGSSATDPTGTTDPTQPTDPNPVLYRHPLTGEQLENPWSGQICAVVMNNAADSLPQWGVSGADILYELEIENGRTRCMALYSDISKVDTIGSIRESRTAFNSIAVAYNAPLIHSGGSSFALDGQYDDSGEKITNWKHLDETSNSQYFYRDVDLQYKGYAYEHTLFAKGQTLLQALKDNGLYTPANNSCGLQFSDRISLKGKNANEITVTFKGSKTTQFTYEAKTGLYKMSQYGKGSMDGDTERPVTFKNVIALYTQQRRTANGVNVFYDTVGSGEGYIAINGQIVPILWSRESLRSPFVYTLGDGTPLSLAVGNTYIALVGIQNPISYK